MLEAEIKAALDALRRLECAAACLLQHRSGCACSVPHPGEMLDDAIMARQVLETVTGVKA